MPMYVRLGEVRVTMGWDNGFDLQQEEKQRPSALQQYHRRVLQQQQLSDNQMSVAEKLALVASSHSCPIAPNADLVPVPRYLMHPHHSKMLEHEEQSSTNDDRERDSVEFFDDDSDDSPVCPQKVQEKMTTLMVRNVPVMYTQEMLMLEWPNFGQYDFLYLPRSAAGQSNLSYVFINFVSEAHAQAFKMQWQKKRLAHFSAKKALNISFAEVQGLDANLMQLKKKRIRRIQTRQCQPVIVKNGQHVEFTEALAALSRFPPV